MGRRAAHRSPLPVLRERVRVRVCAVEIDL
jgi:hypothetical protein